jgi:hypothetical protein
VPADAARSSNGRSPGVWKAFGDLCARRPGRRPTQARGNGPLTLARIRTRERRRLVVWRSLAGGFVGRSPRTCRISAAAGSARSSRRSPRFGRRLVEHLAQQERGALLGRQALEQAPRPRPLGGARQERGGLPRAERGAPRPSPSEGPVRARRPRRPAGSCASQAGIPTRRRRRAPSGTRGRPGGPRHRRPS